MKQVLVIPIAALLLGGCVTTHVEPDGSVQARFGQRISVNGPKVTPLALIEDSRCPMEARCVWAGRVRITARIALGSGSEVSEITLNEPLSVADGKLELVSVMPPSSTQSTIKSADYRFLFRFDGGY